MGLFGKRRERHEEIDGPRIAALEARLFELSDQLDRATRGVAPPAKAPSANPLPAPSGPPPRLLDPDETEAAIAEVRSHLIRIDEQLALLDHRITSVATELAAQVDELGNEIGALEATATRQVGAAGDAERTDTTPASVDPEVVAQLRAAQERLAAEQARYQIAFREDLAELSDRLGR